MLNIHKKHHLTGHKGPIYALAQGKEPHYMYSCSNDLTIVEWNLLEPEYPKAICKIPSKAFSFAFHEQENRLIIGTFKGMLRIVDLAQKQEIKCLELKQGIIYKLVLDHVHERILVLTETGFLTVFSLRTLELIKQVQIAQVKIRGFYMDHELGLYQVGAGDGNLYSLDMGQLTLVHQFKGHEQNFGINALLKVGNQLLSGARDAHILVRNAEHPTEITRRIPAHNFAIYDLKISPCKKYFASASRDKTIKIWSCTTFEVLHRIDFKSNQGHTHSVNCLQWNELGLISAGDDGKIMVWEI